MQNSLIFKQASALVEANLPHLESMTGENYGGKMLAFLQGFMQDLVGSFASLDLVYVEEDGNGNFGIEYQGRTSDLDDTQRLHLSLVTKCVDFLGTTMAHCKEAFDMSVQFATALGQPQAGVDAAARNTRGLIQRSARNIRVMSERDGLDDITSITEFNAFIEALSDEPPSESPADSAAEVANP